MDRKIIIGIIGIIVFISVGILLKSSQKPIVSPVSPEPESRQVLSGNIDAASQIVINEILQDFGVGEALPGENAAFIEEGDAAYEDESFNEF